MGQITCEDWVAFDNREHKASDMTQEVNMRNNTGARPMRIQHLGHMI